MAGGSEWASRCLPVCFTGGIYAPLPLVIIFDVSGSESNTVVAGSHEREVLILCSL